MKKLKVFIILAGILLAGILMTSSKIYAADSSANPMYLGLYNNSNARKTGFYDYLDASKARRPAIKIVKYENAQGLGNVDYLTQIYCLRHGIGFGSEGSTAAIVPYTQHFDMKQPETIGNEYKEAIGITAGVTPNYNKIMWILSNVANPNDPESINALFTAAGINVNDFKGDKAQMTQEEMVDILEAAQQMAIWYYTNPTGDYHPSGTNESLRVGATNQNNSKSPVVSKYYNDEITYPLNELYRYLITKSEEAVNGGYTYQTSAATINFNKDNATYVEEGANYKFGPYNLTYTNNPGITVNIEADVQLGNNIRIVNAQGVEYPGNTVSEKILNANGADFYAVVPKSTNVKTFKIAVSANYQTTDITYWSTSANIAQRNQPVVIVQKAPKAFNDEKIIQVREIPKEFDLALRKFITGIRSATGVAKQVESREPVITAQALDDLATGRTEFKTTAVKTHTKNPLQVETGDIVTYTIRVYNEGDIDGYVREISDYLPAGLELTENSKINQTNAWTKDGKTLKSQFHAKDLIKAFDKNTKTLSYVDFQVECTVLNTANLTAKDLTNVAEITSQEPREGVQVRDRDSIPKNLTKEQITNYNPGTSERGKGYEDDDDYEPLKPVEKEFDLALRKFITAVNGTEITSRIPDVDVTQLVNKTDTTAIYRHSKEPVKIKLSDIVTYTIRVYNEGDIDGYADEIVDHLPEYLEYIDNDFNKQYGWQLDPADNTGRTIKTKYLSEQTNKANIIKKFDGKTLDYKELKIQTRIKSGVKPTKYLTDIAEITESHNEFKIPDRDNYKKVVLPKTSDEFSEYRGHNSNKKDLSDKRYYYKGQEDDDDFEKVVVEGEFDLALRKFITKVNEEAITNRIPQVDTSKFGTIGADGKPVTTMTYNHTKEPLLVNTTDIVTYTIRVYNEGEVNGYASEVKDDIPEGLEFLPENATNKEYRWQLLDKDGKVTTNIKEAVSIVTDYLSKEQEKTSGSNLLKAYDKATMETPDYKDVKIAFKVTEPQTSDRILINKAQISKHHDEFGKEVKDRDSTPNKWNEGEDDQDIEKVRVRYFDLSLRKWVTQVIVIEDGKQKVKDTGHYAEQDPEPVVKVEVNKKRLKNTVVKFRYSIRVKNEGEIEGYAKEISDYIPSGLKFNKADNPDWTEKNGKIVTTKLKDTLLKPGETAEVTVLLTWINGEENMKVMTNTAEISEDYNKYHTPDRDSTPNNRKKGEDDQDDAPVTVTTVSGSAPVYIGIATAGIAIIAIGGILVKRYV